MTYLTKVASVSLQARYRGSRVVDATLEEPTTGLKFRALSLDGVVSLHLGVHDGEVWCRWIWMWESAEEAERAHQKLPAGFDAALEAVQARMRSFLHSDPTAEAGEDKPGSLDLTPLLEGLGLEISAVELTEEQAAHELAQYRKLATRSWRKDGNTRQDD